MSSHWTYSTVTVILIDILPGFIIGDQHLNIRYAFDNSVDSRYRKKTTVTITESCNGRREEKTKYDFWEDNVWLPEKRDSPSYELQIRNTKMLVLKY